jgi:hypothetical protein
MADREFKVLKTLLSSGIAGAAPTYRLVATAQQKGTRRRCADLAEMSCLLR